MLLGKSIDLEPTGHAPGRWNPGRVRTFAELSRRLLALADDDRIKVVSFDVFDTLLFRKCSPEAVQLAVAKDMALFLRRPPEDAHLLIRERHAAYSAAIEAQGGPGAGHDAHLDHIHMEWAKRVAPDEAVLRSQLADHATSSKMRYEGWACYANPAAGALLAELKNRGKTLVFVSDMYLGRGNIEVLLRKCGLQEFFSSGYVSGDHSALKASGRLFEVMLSDLQAEPGSVIHVGDNPEADGQGAAKAGIRSLVVVGREAALAQMRFDQRRAAADPDWHGLCASRFAEPAPPGDSDYAHRRLGRGQLGPVFASYVHGLVEYCASVKADRVYFLSREGLLLKELYGELASVVGLPLPPAGYLCVSRFSAARASMRGFGVREIERACDAAPTSIRRILRHLELDDGELQGLAERHGFEDPDVRVSPETSASFASLVGDRQVQQRAASIGARCRRELVRYLENRHFLDAKCVVLADVGWGGQIPAYLEEALGDLPHPELHSYFMGADRNAARRRKAGIRIVADVWDATRHTWAGAATFKCVHVIENACRAPHGTIVGHRDGEPLIQADDADERIPELVDEPGIALIQAGIREYMDGYSRYVAMTGARASDTVQYARTALARLIYFPRRDELRLLGSLTNVENFGRGESSSLASTPPLTSPRLAWRIIRGSLWREGSMARVAGRGAALLLSALRERNWVRNLPPQDSRRPDPCGPCLSGADPAAVAHSPDPFELAMRHRSRDLLAAAMRESQYAPGKPAVTTFEAISLRASHFASCLLLAASGMRQFPSGLISAGALLERDCVALFRRIVPGAIASGSTRAVGVLSIYGASARSRLWPRHSHPYKES